MISIFKIQDTVLKVSVEAKKLVPEIPEIKSENKLLFELVLCILSSQEKYEVALQVMKKFRQEDILRIPKNKTEFKVIEALIRNTLEKPVKFKFNEKVYSRRLRFFIKKGNYIINTIKNIYFNDLSIKKILKTCCCVNETRKNIIKYTVGLGPKQASMFLRNIGYYSDFAVLDKHVIDYMRLIGITFISETNFSNISSYQKIETKLKSYAEINNLSLLHLDLAIWITMRTLKQKIR